MSRLFGTDGIRFIPGSGPLTHENILRLGRVVGEVVCQRNRGVIVGRDTRASSEGLQQALVTGLLASGVDVIDTGVIPTPAISWGVKLLRADAGIVITASHNPAYENGFKFFDSTGQKFSSSLELEIENELLRESKYPSPKRLNVRKLYDGTFLYKCYVSDLEKMYSSCRISDRKYIIDCANGAASWIAPYVLQRCGPSVITLNCSPNGSNINLEGGAEYIRSHVSETHALLKKFDADFYIAFDGDADRVIMVDSDKNLIDGDCMLGILGSYYEKKGVLRNHTVVTSIMRNSGLVYSLESKMITVIETPVGDRHLTTRLLMMNSNSDSDSLGLGAEQSGHVVLLDPDHVAADGIRSTLHLLKVSSISSASLTDLIRDIKRVPQVVASAYVGMGPRLTAQELEELSIVTRGKYPQITRLVLRYSGTEPYFRIMAEMEETYNAVSLLKTLSYELSKNVQQIAKCDGRIDVLDIVNGRILEQ